MKPLDLVSRLPGKAAVCFLGNTVASYDRAGDLLGRHRVVGGFPGVGGFWDGDVLVYADRRDASKASGSSSFVVIGAAFPEAAEACRRVKKSVAPSGLKVKRYEPILPWQLCHVALVLPLAGLFYRHEGSLQAAVADREGLRQTVQAVAQGLRGLSRLGYPVLPRWLRLLYLLPPSLGVLQLSGLLRTPFAEIALAGHARAARDEVKALSTGLLNVLGDAAGPDCRELLQSV